MTLLSRIRSLFRNLFDRRAVERELNDELRGYVEMVTDENVRAGMTPDAARRAALLQVGGVEQVKEEVRDVRSGAFVETAIQDLRYGLRQLLRAPGFSFVAITTIALGIGANSAIFSVINAVALKPLRYPTSDRLMFITSQFPTLGFDKFWVSPPEYFELRERSRSFTDIAAYQTTAANLSDGARPERVNVVIATANMFDVLGVRPVLGRAFTQAEDLPSGNLLGGGTPVAVMSHELWQRSFGGDSSVVGRMVEIQGRQFRVTGIAPPGFDLHDARAQLWVPSGLDPNNRQNRGNHSMYLVGRLRPGVSQSSAEAELRTLVRQWGTANPGTHVPNDSTHRMQMTPLRDEVLGNVRTALWILQGAVALVLLIACANVANLLLARAETRHKEFAIRTALGAGRSRILRQFTTEGVLLAVLGGIAGVIFARWGLRVLIAANPEAIPRAAEVGLDPRVLLFTAAAATLTGVIFGLAPLVHLRTGSLASSIRESGTRTTASVGGNRIRRGLVVAEIALAVMLVVGAGLLLRSFRNLTTVDAGFDPRELVTYGVALPGATYQSGESRTRFMGELLQRLSATPGVRGSAAVVGLPPFRTVNANDTEFEGITYQPGMPPHNVDYYQTATSSYFDVMGIKLLKGRGFTASDAAGPAVVVINEKLAKVFYPDSDPIGRRIRPPFGDSTPWFTIVGIARNVKQGGLEAEPGTELYFNYEQAPRLVGFAPSQMNVVMRTSLAPDALAPTIRRTMTAMDKGLPVIQLRSMEAVFGDSVARQRFLAQLLGIMAIVALLLAAVGTYGILAYMVSERRREIGIRMALGAGSGQVVRLVIGQGAAMAVTGIVVGVAGALALSRLTASLLFGVSPADPLTFVTVVGVIAIAALVACLVPARRATRVDPLLAMRMD